ncbi:MAG: ABC transporter ATP-binding protein [Candidatus Tectomicrobia bacterium]|nr:ABC transporter ATP-binding protein [Candidatus Tectomicrobia bacterium]
MIRFQSVTKSFGPVEVYREISFEVNRGELVTLFGPSGCGKTTLLRTLAGLEKSDAGRISVDLPQRTGNSGTLAVSIVWQDPRLIPWRTAEENVTFALELKDPSMPRDERVRRAAEALAFVGLSPARNKLPRELSGGMRQRVNLARALALDAPLLLMDEPLANLNEVTEKKLLLDKILNLWGLHAKTILYVTHSVNEALFLSDRIVALAGKPTSVRSILSVGIARPRDLDSDEAIEVRRRLSSLYGGELV